MSRFMLEAKGIHRSFTQGVQTTEVLKGLDISVKPGESLCIVGGSGAGKSTLMHVLGGLDKPSLGEVYFKEKNLRLMTDDQLAKFRNHSVGFVFQFHHLLSEFTALENVMMPLRISGVSRAASSMRATELLKTLDLGHRLKHFPSQLSGGEQQRVAIARALVQRPNLLLADEPTGNLDTENEKRIQKLFFDLQKEFGVALIVVTHDLDFADQFPRVLEMQDGKWKDS